MHIYSLYIQKDDKMQIETTGTLLHLPDSAEVLELHSALEYAVSLEKSAKEQVKILKSKINDKLSLCVAEQLQHEGKHHGTTTIMLGNGLKIKGNIKADVKWDQKRMQGLYEQLSPGDRGKIIKAEFKMDEKTYKAIPANDDLKKELQLARIVTFKPATVEIIKEEQKMKEIN